MAYSFNPSIHPNPLSYEPQPNQIIDLIKRCPTNSYHFYREARLKASSIGVMNLNNQDRQP